MTRHRARQQLYRGGAGQHDADCLGLQPVFAEKGGQIGRLNSKPRIEGGKQDEIGRQRPAREHGHALPTPSARFPSASDKEVSAAAGAAI